VLWSIYSFLGGDYNLFLYKRTEWKSCFIIFERNMALLETISEDFKVAWKAREMDKKGVLNMVLAAAKQKKIDEQKDIGDEDMIKIIKKEAKALHETVEIFTKAGVSDERLVQAQLQLTVLQEYLPTLMSEEETQKIVNTMIAELWIDDINQNMWKLMWAIMAKYKGKIDGSLVRRLITKVQ